MGEEKRGASWFVVRVALQLQSEPLKLGITRIDEVEGDPTVEVRERVICFSRDSKVACTLRLPGLIHKPNQGVYGLPISIPTYEANVI
ncbi:hypothetical protein K2173_017345 [Erythroxylum novogranatense]|uniref:Uncharacterized protein n=1 Tax=Erythroxylum novogranatense TaxID=1862640 RepID=A0AAV8TK97_9ROSI|nr:hypothetical protein K2173_017345 [Erythroxylum novogranatense]